MKRACGRLALVGLALAACTPSEPARIREKPFGARLASSGCKDSFLLHLDPDNCRWMRIDGENGDEEVLLDDSIYCTSYDLYAHPTEPRIFAHLMPDDDRHPEAVREIDVIGGVVRTAAVPKDLYVDYAGYDDHGVLTVLVSDTIPEPIRPVKFFYSLIGRETCEIGRARALALDGKRWKETASEAGDCENDAPLEDLHTQVIAPATMPGTISLFNLPRVDDARLLAKLNESMELEDQDEAPVWRERVTPHGRIARAGNDYGDAFWLAFVDSAGNVAREPAYDDNVKMRLRGRWLLTSSDGEENAKLYDSVTGRLTWEAPSYSTTMFWPCPTPTP